MYANETLKCDGTNWGPCSGDVTHIDQKGYVYCTRHGLVRRNSRRPCRKLRLHELRKLQKGGILKHY